MTKYPKTSFSLTCNKCSKPIYPKNKIGLPFSGNNNDPGNLLNPGLKFSTKIHTKKNAKQFSIYSSNPIHESRSVRVYRNSFN